jgi:hypothetical protein
VDERFVNAQAGAWLQYRAHSAHDETTNGPGSYLRNTEAVRAWLPHVFDRYHIESMLDVPCGDWNWMRHVDLTNIEYTGWDVEPTTISQNQARFGYSHWHFECVNLLTVDRLPAVDLIFCRKFLTHLPNTAIRHVLDKFLDSGAHYLIADNYHAANDVACPLDGGHTGAVGSPTPLPGYYYRPVNLEADPFNLPGRVEAIDEPGLPGEQYAEIRQEMVLFDLQQPR